jgi:hypothetical protein
MVAKMDAQRRLFALPETTIVSAAVATGIACYFRLNQAGRVMLD